MHPDDAPDLATKLARLRAVLATFDKAAVAYSGGVDSSYLLSACADTLGTARVLAVTVDSPFVPRADMATARQIAQQLGVEHRIVPFDDLAIPEVAVNPARRCYYCKRARFTALLAQMAEIKGMQVVHGENADDHLDYRPGSAAAQELGVRAPLSEAGLTKADIRTLSRQRGLPTWDHPSAACLASRFPYDTPLTREGLERVERAEELLQQMLKLRHLRVRDHFPIARIEVAAEEVAQLAAPALRVRIAEGLHALGYRYVTLDLDGYRMGSLNAGLTTSS
jgi:pyridinium-3,5-biscarboxylic acid mononucleotide sulfurtransferase